MRNTSRILLAVICLGLGSCATTETPRIRSLVDSIADRYGSDKKLYLVLPGNKGVSEDDLQFREFAHLLDNALHYNGFVRTHDPRAAELVVFLSYGIGEPTTHSYTYSFPTWGQTGVSSSQTTGTMSSYGRVGTYSERTTYTPQYGITEVGQGTGTYTVFTRYVVADAYDVSAYKRDQRMVQSWKTTVTSTGRSGDLRRVLPYMLGASKSHFGTNTSQAVEVIIEENPRLVTDILR